jgi:hypothetical protein
VVIAMDCLKRLSQRLPEYRRVLDVIIAVIESGLYVKTEQVSFPDPSRDDEEVPHHRKLLYFEAYRALQNLASSERTRQLPSSGRASLKGYPCSDKTSDLTYRQRVEMLLSQLEAEDDKKELFGLLLRDNLTVLAAPACEELLTYFLDSEAGGETAHVFFSLLMQHLHPVATIRLLTEISQAHSTELQQFALDNIDALLGETPPVPNEKTRPALFQRLVDRHPQEFAAILWRSPYLTAHIFQVSMCERT